MRKTINTCERVFKTENIIQNAIIPEIINTLGHVYPELEKNFNNICETFSYQDEINRTMRTKNRIEFKSLNLPTNSTLNEDDVIDFSGFSSGFRDIEKQMKLNPSMKSLSIEYAFDRLHTGFGLSEDLIEKIAQEMNLVIDMDEFAKYKQNKQTEAKQKYQHLENELLNRLSKENIPKTDSNAKYDYEFDSVKKQYDVKKLRAEILFTASSDDNLHHIVLDRTNFYHTAGGQDNDIGKIISIDGEHIFNVENVELHKDNVIHSGRFENTHSKFDKNQVVDLFIDSTRRTGLTQHHTSMHLLQAAMKQITQQITFQNSSHVSHSNLKCNLGSNGLRIDMKQIAEIENLFRKIIATKIPIECSHLSAHELYALDNLTTVPGAVYPDNGIRVLKIVDETNKFASIEPCCGTHANNTAELHDFCFTSIKYNNNNSYDIVAIAGRLVEEAKQREKDFLEKFQLFKDKICNVSCIDEWKAIEIEADKFEKYLTQNQIPYLTKAKCLTEMENIEKTITVTQRAQLRERVVLEMTNVLTKRIENNQSFIVHVIDTPYALEENLIAEAIRIGHDLPVIILNTSNNKIMNGRACIPSKYISAKFNANHWLQEFVHTFKMKCDSVKKKKLFTTCKLIEIPDKIISSNDLDQSLNKTKEMAGKMFNKIVSEDQNERLNSEDKLLTEMNSIKTTLNKDTNNLDDVFNLESRIKTIRNHIKDNLFLYTFTKNCTNQLVEMAEQINAARFELEKYGPFNLKYLFIVIVFLILLNSFQAKYSTRTKEQFEIS